MKHRFGMPMFLRDEGEGGGGTPAPAPAPEPPAAERTFTQAELDKIVQDRLARAKRELPDDYEDLKAAKAELDEVKKSQLSELEQAQKAREEAEKKAADALARANARLLQAEILREATEQKAIRPEHMHRLIDTESVTVGDDGQVTGVQEAVKAFLETNPEYVGKGRVADPVDQGARGTTPTQLTREDLANMTPDQINKAREEGRTDQILGRLK
ncbi:MAG TPA: DUF4355 domain-containing protein [Gemmatimonadales bacterium]|nr:DUF4355 domain-containing protein [Gemmatimonadales bacterium]